MDGDGSGGHIGNGTARMHWAGLDPTGLEMRATAGMRAVSASGSAGGGEAAVSNPNTMAPSVMGDMKRTVVTLSRDFAPCRSWRAERGHDPIRIARAAARGR